MQLDKVTDQPSADKPPAEKPPADKRSYDDACGMAHALDLIGERWALLVLRELMLGPRRFSGLKADLPGISSNVLAQRLVELEARGLVRKLRLPPPASVQVYEATEWGLEAEPIVQALGRWAARSPRHDPTLPISAVSVLLSFRTMIDPARASGLNARFGFRFGETAFVAHLYGGSIDIARGDPAGCDVIFNASPIALAAVVHGGAPLGTIEVEGDLKLAARFTTLFPLPLKLT